MKGSSADLLGLRVRPIDLAAIELVLVDWALYPQEKARGRWWLGEEDQRDPAQAEVAVVPSTDSLDWCRAP